MCRQGWGDIQIKSPKCNNVKIICNILHQKDDGHPEACTKVCRHFPSFMLAVEMLSQLYKESY